MQAVVSDPLAGKVPPWLHDLLLELSVSPISTTVPGAGEAEPFLKSIGKRLSDLLGLTVTPPPKSGLPSRLTLGGFHPDTNEVQFFGDSQAASPRFEASPSELDSLLASGGLDLEQPPQSGVDQIRARLRSVLDAAGPQFKDQQFTRAQRKR